MIDNNLIENRHIRVFISSTFQDMQDERDYLMKRTFPKLRQLAAQRDVTITELDLRWGITEEEAKAGKVVDICLREIENCIPFFIGIIGNRYGWVPEEKDLDRNVTDHFPAVKTYLERKLSVTEMEMQFGVLRRMEKIHAYFYIKEDDEDTEVDNPAMLERLKEEVKASDYPSSYYSTPESLAVDVEQAFTALLNELYPEGNLSPLEKERIGQRSFMRQLCQNYIRDERNFHALDEWMKDLDSHQMVVTGASGLGKSALIANWVQEKLNDESRDYNIIYHFTGNGGSESSHKHIMKTLCDEINDVYGWNCEEDKSKPLENILNDLFLRVSSEGKRPLLIVIDAINQIVDINNAKLLNWLPIPPRNIKILFSTLEDDCTMAVFKKHNYTIFVLGALDIEKREQLINNYLKLYGKSLHTKQLTRISNDLKCENTLLLKTLLDEIINFGVYEMLDKYIEDYLSPSTVEDFYQMLLYNYEKEFGKDTVEHCLTLISISHLGLTEREIMRIAAIREVDWVTLYCALFTFLTSGNGQILFSHIHFSNAVSKRYDRNNNFIISYRRNIIEVVSEISPQRAALEVPFQLYHLNDTKSLYFFVKREFEILITLDEKWAAFYIQRILGEGVGILKEFLLEKGKHDRPNFWYADFIFSYPIIVRSALIQVDGIIKFLEPYLRSSRFYPNCIHRLAETYESIDINRAIEFYKLEIKYYGEKILLPPPGFLKEEEQMDIWHRIQELKN